MSDKKNSATFGNVSINHVGRNTTVKQAGRDIVENETIKTSVFTGFKQEEDKHKFLQQLEMICFQLQTIRTELSKVESTSLNEDDKYDLINTITQQIKKSAVVKEEVSDLPIGTKPPGEKSNGVKKWIDDTKKVLENAKAFGEKVAEIQLKIGPYLEKVLSLISWIN